MEPLLMVLVPGVLGGIVLAVFIARIRVREVPQRERPLDPPNPGLINMASIRIQGIGGLGMVAMATAVAIGEPRIRIAMALAFVLSLVLAAVLIIWRRRTGPFPWNEPGAHSMLPIDSVAARRDGRPRSPRGGTNRRLLVTSAR